MRKGVISGSIIQPVTDDELHQWNSDLSKLINLPVGLSNFTEFSVAFKPASVLNNVPTPLTHLFNQQLEEKSIHFIDQECEKYFKRCPSQKQIKKQWK